jgi:hypothetical protein
MRALVVVEMEPGEQSVGALLRVIVRASSPRGKRSRIRPAPPPVVANLCHKGQLILCYKKQIYLYAARLAQKLHLHY